MLAAMLYAKFVSAKVKLGWLQAIEYNKIDEKHGWIKRAS